MLTRVFLRALRTLLLVAVGVALPMAAVAKAGPKARPPLVLAAASLQEAMQAAADRWAGKGHMRPILSFAGSAALARQIESGARADLFISADEAWMDHVAAKGLLRPGTRSPLLSNRLALVAPAKSSIRLSVGKGFPLATALGRGRLAMGDPASVPAGRYARQALERLQVWKSVAGRIAPAENVRLALLFVSRREAPLGIVYASDARADPGVRVVSVFPESSHRRIVYPIAGLKHSTSPEAEQFRRFLLSREGQAIFRKFGFRPA